MKWNKKLAKAIVLLGTGMMLCGCGKQANVQDFAAYAESVENITLPEETRVVALGEASHGNKEFQELKLDVFAHLVETTNVRGLALEGDFSGCAIANRYIVNDEGTAKEVVKLLGYEIYRTDEMLELVQWMHDYNASASAEDKVRLYGVDMQRDIPAIKMVKDFYSSVDASKGEMFGGKLDGFYGDTERAFKKENLPQMEMLVKEIIADMEENAATYTQSCSEETYAYALQATKCLLQNIALHASGNDYGTIRDKNMTENAKWILDREERLYGTKLMLAGHNGHVAKTVSTPYVNMGSYLYEELGSAYYVIGTDFYNTTCNIATQDGRADYKFCSDDPLAKAVGEMEENMYYLDFVKAKESEELADMISSSIPTGNLGENYSPLMKVMKKMYQTRIAPEELYDGMIFVYDAAPIRVWGY